MRCSIQSVGLAFLPPWGVCPGEGLSQGRVLSSTATARWIAPSTRCSLSWSTMCLCFASSVDVLLVLGICEVGSVGGVGRWCLATLKFAVHLWQTNSLWWSLRCFSPLNFWSIHPHPHHWHHTSSLPCFRQAPHLRRRPGFGSVPAMMSSSLIMERSSGAGFSCPPLQKTTPALAICGFWFLVRNLVDFQRPPADRVSPCLRLTHSSGCCY